jgi:hypothetical protein
MALDKIQLIIACLEALVEVLKMDTDKNGTPDIVDLICVLGKRVKKSQPIS